MKELALVLVLIGRLILGEYAGEQSNSQTNNDISLEQPYVNEENEPGSNESAKEIINPYHPIVFIERTYDDKMSSATVLGGYKDNKWYTLDDFDYYVNGKKATLDSFFENQLPGGKPVSTKILKGNETFKIYSDSQFLSTVNAKGSNPTMFVSPASGQSILSFEIDAIETKEDFIIGINGDWDALPRVPQILSDNSIVVDLDNDNVDEKITARVLGTTETDYTVLVEMEKGNKKVKISECYFYVMPGEKVEEPFKNFKMMALDVNGDEKMEIITYSIGPAGGISVAKVNGTDITDVLGYDSGE